MFRSPYCVSCHRVSNPSPVAPCAIPGGAGAARPTWAPSLAAGRRSMRGSAHSAARLLPPLRVSSSSSCCAIVTGLPRTDPSTPGCACRPAAWLCHAHTHTFTHRLCGPFNGPDSVTEWAILLELAPHGAGRARGHPGSCSNWSRQAPPARSAQAGALRARDAVGGRGAGSPGHAREQN